MSLYFLTGLTAQATGDNRMIFYADGAELTPVDNASNLNEWFLSNKFDLPADSEVIGIKCRDLGKCFDLYFYERLGVQH